MGKLYRLLLEGGWPHARDDVGPYEKGEVFLVAKSQQHYHEKWGYYHMYSLLTPDGKTIECGWSSPMEHGFFKEIEKERK